MGKPFVAVGGRTLLGGTLEALRAIGCLSITCLVRAEHAEAARAIASWAGCSQARVVACVTPSSLHTLAVGLGAVPEGPVLAMAVDVVMPRADFHALSARIEADLATGADFAVAVTPRTDDDLPTYVAYDAGRRVVRVSDDRIEPAQIVAGIYGLGPRARTLARAVVDRGQSRVRSLLASCVKEGLVVRAIETPRIVDVDRPIDVTVADAWLRGLGEAAP
ncbi:Nucleoside-diphosphate-sugar pyrophosphorylase [Minicystis rosea]|nr:Nucleoside-diphosphate-sugar pyrophosphorylase [Minicystis rosea]